MKILAFDTETTGLFDYRLPAEDIGQPYLCSVAGILFDGESGAVVRKFHHLIQPDGWEVPEDVVKIHGLTTAHLQKHGVPALVALNDLNTAINECTHIIGFGVDFDLKVSRGAFKRANMISRYGERPQFCVMQAARNVCNIAPTNAMMATGRKISKNPKLAEAVELILRKRMEGAHDAMVDIAHTVELYLHMKQHHPSMIKWKQNTPDKNKAFQEIETIRAKLADQGFTVTDPPPKPSAPPIDDDIF